MAPALPHSVWLGVYTLLQESAGKRLELKRTMIPHDLLAPGELVVQPHCTPPEGAAFGTLRLSFSVVVLSSRSLQHDNVGASPEVVADICQSPLGLNGHRVVGNNPYLRSV